MRLTSCVLLALLPCALAFSFPDTERFARNSLREIVRSQEKMTKVTGADAQCDTLYTDGYEAYRTANPSSCSMTVLQFVSSSAFAAGMPCDHECWPAYLAGIEAIAGNTDTSVDCSMWGVDKCDTTADCDSGSTCSSTVGYCGSTCSANTDCFDDSTCEGGACIDASDAKTFAQFRAELYSFCATNGGSTCQTLFMQVGQSFGSGPPNCTSIETTLGCCLHTLRQCSGAFQASGGACEIGGVCAPLMRDAASDLCTGITASQCASDTFSAPCLTSPAYQCGAQLLANGLTRITADGGSCTAALFDAQHTASISLAMATSAAAVDFSAYCGNACQSTYAMSWGDLTTYEASSGFNCAAAFFDSSSEDDTDTDTEGYVSDSEGGITTAWGARNLFKAACETNSGSYCYTLIDALTSGDADPTCEQLTSLGCCGGVLSNCLGEFFATNATEICSLAATCPGFEIGVDSCSSTSNMCDSGMTTPAYQCPTPSVTAAATPSPSPASTPAATPSLSPSPTPSIPAEVVYRVRAAMSFAGVTCESSLDTEQKRTLFINSVNAALREKFPEAAAVTFELACPALKQTTASGTSEVAVTSAAEAATATTSVQDSSFQSDFVAKVNTQVNTAFTAASLTPPSVSSVSVTSVEVSNPSTTSGSAMVGVSLVALLAALFVARV